MNEEYYIGQIFEGSYPSMAAVWCKRNNAQIQEIDPITKEVEETYIEIVQQEQEVVVPAVTHEEIIPAEYDEDGNIVKEEETVVVVDEPEHTEIITIDVPEERTHTVEKTFHRYEIQAIPEPTTDEKKVAVRAVRDGYLNGTEWRVSRYRGQVEIGTETTDSNATYIKILQYMQYLRDYPESSVYWYEHEPKTFEEWKNNN